MLVAGSIERANHLLPQIQKNRIFSYSQAISGSKLILWGLFKKIVIADNLAIIADKYFDAPHSYDSFSLIIGVIAFSFQIYCDFSGYTDIALGSAKLLGFELLSNFKFPYFARDIAEFWRRWHISLSSWFRDYLYIPLGGSQKGKLIATRNTFIIFLVSGFWHGASWNFIIWGFLHAIFFIPYLLLSKNRNNVNTIVASDKNFPSISELTKIFFTFSLVCFAWIFFRAENLNDSIIYVKQLCFDAFNNPSQFLRIGQHFIYPQKNLNILWVFPLLFVEWRFRFNERSLHLSNSRKVNILFYLIISILILNYLLQTLDKEPSGFIYFQF